MSTTQTDSADLVLGLADPDVAAAVTVRLSNTAESEAPTPCARCGSPNCSGSTGWRPRPVDVRSAAEIVADVWGALPAGALPEETAVDATAAAADDGTPPAPPRVLRGVLPLDPGKRPASLTPAEFALRPDLTPDELSALLALDNPEVDARLFGHPALDDGERRRLLDGVRSDGTVGPVGAPLADLPWTIDKARLRRLLPLAIRSGDPRVASAVVGRVELQTEAGRLRPIVAVWARHGAEAARRLLESASYPTAEAEAISRALAAPDGLDTLRARMAELGDPAYMVTSLRALESDRQAWHVEQIAAEGGRFPWAELIRSHADEPLPLALHSALAEVPDCPRELLLLRLRAGMPEVGDGAVWLDAAMEGGVLSPLDLVRHACPAASALVLFEGPADHDRRARWDASTPRTDIGALFRAKLGANPDTWFVAVRLIDQFSGSIAELLDTAVAATHKSDV